MHKSQILWDESKCRLCLKCVDACPQNAIKHEHGRIVIDFAACDGCQICVKECGQSALKNEGKRMDLNEIIREVLKDRDFYEESGGGVTLSGGEVLAQADFALELLKELKALGVHTALETTGYAPQDVFEQFLPHVDLFLFDVKHMDCLKHEKHTGVKNDVIRVNLQCALNQHKSIIARIPVIPGFNDSLEDAQAFVNYFNEIGLCEVNLLPYHKFGEMKYRQLNRDYPMGDVKNLHPEDLLAYQSVFTQAKIKATF